MDRSDLVDGRAAGANGRADPDQQPTCGNPGSDGVANRQACSSETSAEPHSNPKARTSQALSLTDTDTDPDALTLHGALGIASGDGRAGTEGLAGGVTITSLPDETSVTGRPTLSVAEFRAQDATSGLDTQPIVRLRPRGARPGAAASAAPHIYRMRLEGHARLKPVAPGHREFPVEVDSPLFGAVGRLALPAPVRLSDFVNGREGFLRLSDVEFLSHGDTTAKPELGPTTDYVISDPVGIEVAFR